MHAYVVASRGWTPPALHRSRTTLDSRPRCFMHVQKTAASSDTPEQRAKLRSRSHINSNIFCWCARTQSQERNVNTLNTLSAHDGVGAMYSFHTQPNSYDHKPSHPYNARTEHVGFSSTWQTSRAPSAKRREMFWGGGGATAQTPTYQRSLAVRLSHSMHLVPGHPVHPVPGVHGRG